MLANELRQAGVDTVVIERLTAANEWSRSLTLQARSVEILAQRGLHWFADYPHIRSYNFGLLELTDVMDPHLVPLLVPQRILEAKLEQRAVGLGAEIRRGAEVVGLDQDDDGVTVTIRSGAGEYSMRAAYLVGCDGGSSRVRKLAGIDFPGTASTIDGITGDVHTAETFEQRIPPKLFDTGLFAVTPLAPGHFRVTVIEFGTELTSKTVPVTVDEFREKIRRVAGVDPEVLRAGKAQWLSRFGNPTRLAERYRSGRVLLAGDSAHIHLPVSGQGLNTGLQDAWNLGWKLAATVRGWAPPGLLDTYHSERHPVGARVCSNTAAQDALMYPLTRVAPLRELFAELLKLPSVNRYVTDMLTGVGIRYEMNQPDGHPMLGRRIPDLPVTTATGATSVWRLLNEGRGVLLRSADGPPPPSGWQDRVCDVTVDRNSDLPADLVLVRPDGHVAYLGPETEPLRVCLKDWFGDPQQ
jgi:2-polyprenyl-6-methoxyphenol hydroxylase-like FAD-dependent oxidoreductase